MPLGLREQRRAGPWGERDDARQVRLREVVPAAVQPTLDVDLPRLEVDVVPPKREPFLGLVRSFPSIMFGPGRCWWRADPRGGRRFTEATSGNESNDG
jgi:hypothetical protein